MKKYAGHYGEIYTKRRTYLFYCSLTDIVKYKSNDPDDVIKNGM